MINRYPKIQENSNIKVAMHASMALMIDPSLLWRYALENKPDRSGFTREGASAVAIDDSSTFCCQKLIRSSLATEIALVIKFS